MTVVSPSNAARLRQVALAGVVALVACPAPAVAATTGANATHDPSRIVESNGLFYFCSTGGQCASSSDGLAWKNTGLRITVPAWSTQYMPGGNQGVWAPDILFYQGRFYIYYSFCGVPAAQAPCAIGLYTTPTLDSTSSSFKLTDAGMVVNNPKNDATFQFSTIDPAPITDVSGNLWSAWGSGYGKDQAKTQLWVTRLSEAGLPLASDTAYSPPTTLGHALEPGRKEGAYLHYHGGYYYLFYNTGACCSGTASDYTTWVARSANITGPFSGDKIFYESNGNVHGPGHMGIYSACGVERFTYHYYPSATSILGENELTWGSDGWPVAGPPSTTPLVPCGSSSGGGSGAGGASSAGGAATGGTTSARGGAGGTAGRGGAGGTAARGGATSAGGAGAGGASSAAGGSSVGSAGATGIAGSTGTSMGGAASNGGTASGGGATIENGGANFGGVSAAGGASGSVASGGKSGASSGGVGTEDARGGTGSAGSSSAEGGKAPPRYSNESDSGCSCVIERSRRGPNALAWLWTLGALIAWRRRKLSAVR